MRNITVTRSGDRGYMIVERGKDEVGVGDSGGVHTEDELRANLQRRGVSHAEIDRIIQECQEDGMAVVS